MEWICDRLAWVVAVEAGLVPWGFKGLQRIDHTTLRKSGHNQLVTTMLHDERFMDNYMHAEIEWAAKNEDFDERWEEWARAKLQQEHCCTEGAECDVFKQELEKLLEDKDARWEWATHEFEWEWIRESIINSNDGESLEYALKEHPVEEVYSRVQDVWLDLDDVVGYCPSCNEPLTKAQLDKEDNIHNLDQITPHPYSIGPCDCDGEHDLSIRCYFDRDGKRRPLFECESCYFVDALDDLEETFISRHGHPFNWAPGAPFPPRMHFDGTWMNPAATEEP